MNPSLAELTKAKSFPENFVVEYEMPSGNGRLVRLSYAIGELSGTPGYKPRKADPRVGYFYNNYSDFAKPANEDITERFINRWYVEKADPKLKMSPPKQPIVWYIENTTPVQFRRYVREGIELWNEAFREIGIDGRGGGVSAGRRDGRAHGQGPRGRPLQLLPVELERPGLRDRPEPHEPRDRRDS